LKNKKEMKKLLSLNCLGEIPHVESKYKNNDQDLLIINRDIDPGFVEEYKHLTEMVTYASERSKVKTLIVTSAVPEEGKTNVSVNF